MSKYLGSNTLSILWNKIKQLVENKVDKVEGKQLSTNDFTEDYKKKLDNLDNTVQINLSYTSPDQIISGEIITVDFTHEQKQQLQSAITNKQTVDITLASTGTNQVSHIIIPYEQWKYSNQGETNGDIYYEYSEESFVYVAGTHINIYILTLIGSSGESNVLMMLHFTSFGNSDDFVKADGSIDSNTYLTADSLSDALDTTLFTGTENQFVKGDGSFDSTEYAPKSDVVLKSEYVPSDTITVDIDITQSNQYIELTTEQCTICYNAGVANKPIKLQLQDTTNLPDHSPTEIIIRDWSHISYNDQDCYVANINNSNRAIYLLQNDLCMISVTKQDTEYIGSILFTKFPINELQVETLDGVDLNTIKPTTFKHYIVRCNCTNVPINNTRESKLLVVGGTCCMQIYVEYMTYKLYIRWNVNNVWTIWNTLNDNKINQDINSNSLNELGSSSNVQFNYGTTAVDNVPTGVTNYSVITEYIYTNIYKQTLTAKDGTTYCRMSQYADSIQTWLPWECVWIPESVIPVIDVSIDLVEFEATSYKNSMTITLTTEQQQSIIDAHSKKIPFYLNITTVNGENTVGNVKVRYNYDRWESTSLEENAYVISTHTPYASLIYNCYMIIIIQNSTAEINILIDNPIYSN